MFSSQRSDSIGDFHSGDVSDIRVVTMSRHSDGSLGMPISGVGLSHKYLFRTSKLLQITAGDESDTGPRLLAVRTGTRVIS